MSNIPWVEELDTMIVRAIKGQGGATKLPIRDVLGAVTKRYNRTKNFAFYIEWALNAYEELPSNKKKRIDHEQERELRMANNQFTDIHYELIDLLYGKESHDVFNNFRVSTMRKMLNDFIIKDDTNKLEDIFNIAEEELQQFPKQGSQDLLDSAQILAQKLSSLQAKCYLLLEIDI